MGIASRRKADEMILSGRVCLNNITLKSPGVMVDMKKDTVSIDNKTINTAFDTKFVYIMMNKPAGHITTLKDTHGRRIVMDILPKIQGIFPVGRLDKQTTGLLIFTNDGELCHRLMHPSYEIEKIYDVTISGHLKKPDMVRIERGVDIGDNRPSCLKILSLKPGKSDTTIAVEIHEGRKRQVRRTFEALGYTIKALRRTFYAGIGLDIGEGDYRELKKNEVNILKKAAGIKC